VSGSAATRPSTARVLGNRPGPARVPVLHVAPVGVRVPVLGWRVAQVFRVPVRAGPAPSRASCAGSRDADAVLGGTASDAVRREQGRGCGTSSRFRLEGGARPLAHGVRKWHGLHPAPRRGERRCGVRAGCALARVHGGREWLGGARGGGQASGGARGEGGRGRGGRGGGRWARGRWCVARIRGGICCSRPACIGNVGSEAPRSFAHPSSCGREATWTSGGGREHASQIVDLGVRNRWRALNLSLLRHWPRDTTHSRSTWRQCCGLRGARRQVTMESISTAESR
jgi:hypothetical protein